MSSMITAIVVAELPALRAVDGSAPPLDGGAGGGSGTPAAPPPQPKFVLIMPHSDPGKLPKNVLSFCFPDLDQLARAPFRYDHTAEEYTFTLTPKDEPRVHGYCRRYRVGAPWLGSRLDLSPYSAADAKAASATPLFQCICILSERPYHRLFSQCLQLLHAARLAGGPVAMRLARQLSFENPSPGQLLSLRGLFTATQVPGTLHFPRERLRVPPFFGLPYSDVPLTPLLMRLDAPALLALYVAMLCERRIIFVSQSIGTLTSCVHAAAALLQPFEWQNIYIPVMSTSYLAYCCAPNPYLLGLSPAQFTQLCDEYGAGEIVLVALDEGYVAALNNSIPLVDLEGPASSNAGTGEVSYAGPKLSMERAASRVGVPAGSGLGMDSPSAGGGGMPRPSSGDFASVAASLAGGGGTPLPSSPGTTMFPQLPPAAAGGGGEASFSPFHAFSRSHAYDDEVVMSRIQRRGYAGRRLAAKRAARDRIAVIYGKDVGGDAAANRARSSQAAHAGGDDIWGVSDAADVSFDGSLDAARAPSVGATTALATAAAWGGPVDPAEAWASTGGGAPPSSAPPPSAAPKPALAAVSPGGAAELLAARRRSGAGIVAGSAAGPARPALAPIVTAALVAPLADAAIEIDGSIADEFGVAQLPVDLSSLTTRGDSAVGKRRVHKRPVSSVAIPEISGLSGGAGKEMSMYKRAIANAGKVLAYATGGPASDCPCARLVFELRALYAREKRDGAFDEAGVYAAFLAFVAVVFGRAADFEHAEGDSHHRPGGGGGGGGHPIFAKEEFVRYTVRHATVARLLDEVQHSQLLQALASESYTRSRAAAFLAGDPAHVAAARAAPPNVVDLAFAEAAASAAAGAGMGTHGSGGSSTQRSVSGGGATPSVGSGSSFGATASGPAALLGPPPSYNTILKRVSGVLSARFDPIFDLGPNALGTDRGIAGSTLSAVKALDALSHAAMSVTAVATPTPEPGPATVVTALRALIAAATSTAAHPEEPPSVIARSAVAASHDPSLCSVVLGVIWARINDCTERNWQHGYKALMLLLTLLRSGSPRVMSQAVAFVPLLRFLIHPTRALAAHAAYAAEDMNGQAFSSSWVAAANVLRCSRNRGGGGLFSGVPGVLLSTAPQPLAAIGPAEGAGMVAKAAGRVYAILVAPRRWLIERALVIGPAAVMHASPLMVPLPCPLTLPVCVTAPTAAGSVPGWLPTVHQASHPSGGGWHSDFGYDEGRGSHAAVISVGASSVKKQPQAASVDWPTVHRVAVPCMASSSSSALRTLAAEYGVDPTNIVARPAAIPARPPSPTFEALPAGADAQIAHKRPHSLAACFAIPHDTEFGNVRTVQGAKGAGAHATAIPASSSAGGWFAPSASSAPPSAAPAKAPPPPALAAGEFDVFGPAAPAAAPAAAPPSRPPPASAAFSTIDAPTVSFGTPAGKQAPPPVPLAVPSSEFEFGSAAPAPAPQAVRSAAASSSSVGASAGSSSSSPFDSWATGHAPAPAAPPSSSQAAPAPPTSVPAAPSHDDLLSLAPAAQGAAAVLASIALSQGVLGPQSHAARAAAISQLGGTGPAPPPYGASRGTGAAAFLHHPTMQPFTQPPPGGRATPLAAATPAAATPPAATDPFGFDASPAPPQAARPPPPPAADAFGFDVPAHPAAAAGSDGWETTSAAAPASSSAAADPFGFPDVPSSSAPAAIPSAAADPFAF